jgi:hypothetical protein
MAPRIAKRFDPEDVVLSAYRSFFVRARNGKFSLLHSGDLWRLLVGIVLKKLYHQIARHTAAKRSIDRERALPAGGDSAWSLIPLAGPSPTAEQAIEMADLMETFMTQLDPRARHIFELRLHDERIEEIATATGLNEKTVRRILAELELRLRSLLLETADRQPRSTVTPGDSNRNLPDANVRRPAGEPERCLVAASHKSFLDVDHDPSDADHSNAYHSDRDFVIEMHLGTGGIGRVYRARRKNDDSLVAIKMLRKRSQRDPSAVARFLDEARTVARLDHPGIVSVQGIGRTRNGGFFLVQELVRGQNLAEVAAKRPIAVAAAAGWVAAAADALDHAHRNGVVHCDLKPANLLLDSCGRVRVTDFGLARFVASGNTFRTSIAGTFGYMAPEQLDASWGDIGPCTDVFGLGAVLFSLLTGRAPFVGKTISDLFQSLLESAPTLSVHEERPEVPPEFDKIIRTCVALNPRDRFATAGELQEALQPFAGPMVSEDE